MRIHPHHQPGGEGDDEPDDDNEPGHLTYRPSSASCSGARSLAIHCATATSSPPLLGSSGGGMTAAVCHVVTRENSFCASRPRKSAPTRTAAAAAVSQLAIRITPRSRRRLKLPCKRAI